MNGINETMNKGCSKSNETRTGAHRGGQPKNRGFKGRMVEVQCRRLSSFFGKDVFGYRQYPVCSAMSMVIFDPTILEAYRVSRRLAMACSKRAC